MKGFKTIAFGITLILTAVFSDAAVQAFVAEHFKTVGASIGLVVIALRAITNSGILKSE